ncbi:hypothetical protein CEW89_01555 [Celeribacter ethanolicus]|uniref:DUF3307 domain-containing protein n=1 Tax=Celeribacter ethanolicus TaxID=1758178 RepID=A0A291G879_9RHOB|nr:DUF3307 domain-containing protein [Celeribacter ethanolicus]ATG46367.1 hypothetical protein CEW89_01555 [Celeribacter ethanolicus]
MLETLAALFLAHVLADYVFQTRWMVEEKSRPETLFLHALIVLLTAMATTGQVASPMIYALALIHIVIDTVKTRFFSDTFIPHITDQALHLVTLTLIALIAPDLFPQGPYAALAWLPKAMLFTAGAIYATRAGGFAVGKLMERFGPNPIGDSLDKGGFWIGLLERGLIFLLLIGQMAGGIGFLVAAKSVLRFEAAQEGKKAEWVIIGTLASFGWAIAVTLAVMFIAAQLPPLGISPLND